MVWVAAFVLLLAGATVAAYAGGDNAAAGTVNAGEVTTPLLVTDDRWSYFGGQDDAKAFSEAISGAGSVTVTSGGETVQYIWGRWESCLTCGKQGAASFAKPGTMVMVIRDGKVAAVRVCCGSKTVELKPTGSSVIAAVSR